MIRLKRYEVKPLVPVVAAMGVFFALMFLSGFWQVNQLGNHTYFSENGKYGTLFVPVLPGWFIGSGMVMLVWLSIVFAGLFNVRPEQLRFQLIQPVSRSQVLWNVVQRMGMVVGIFALTGTLVAVLSTGTAVLWGWMVFKNMLMMWMVAMFWGLLTLALMWAMRLPSLVILPVMAGVAMMVMLGVADTYQLSAAPLYQLKFILPVEELHQGISNHRVRELLDSGIYKHTVVGDAKLLWAVLSLGAVYFMAQWGFNRRKLF